MSKNNKKKVGAYPFFSVVFSTALALFIVGILGLTYIQTQKLTQRIKSDLEMQVFLKREVNKSKIAQFQRKLSQQSYILAPANDNIRFISKEEAAKTFLNDTGEDFSEFLGENPLHDAFTIKLKSGFQNSDSLEMIKQELEKFAEVSEVTYVKNLADQIQENFAKLSVILVTIAILLFFVVTILINNTIKLALFSQRFLIRSMQLVGATSGFIQKPFILRSIWHGFLGGIIACLGISGVLYYAVHHIDALSLLYAPKEVGILFGTMIITGITVSFFSTKKSVKKYLGMSLNDLY
ncbi:MULTISPECIES: cell division protein FtsX [Persicobacter]|uniref:Cell division protein FtsX n=1 Tax=Persicobacter diffluens TaxID=981 RepID=A0AAN5ALD6_9BACT|nr:permease-like cell division protein FtsX [Persicobacter sp. CCB-QB2]GJM60763.1 cell division protein FtsX [Persicobacter diffluens]